MSRPGRCRSRYSTRICACGRTTYAEHFELCPECFNAGDPEKLANAMRTREIDAHLSALEVLYATSARDIQHKGVRGWFVPRWTVKPREPRRKGVPPK